LQPLLLFLCQIVDNAATADDVDDDDDDE